MSIKIQINSLEALERLIGGDNELEISVRNSVVQKFTEKHLKALANSDVVGNAISEINRQIRAEVQEKLNKEVATFKTDWNGRFENIKLNPAIQQEISREFQRQVDSKIGSAVKEATDAWAKDENIKERINNAVSHYNEQTINHAVKKKFDELIKKV